MAFPISAVPAVIFASFAVMIRYSAGWLALLYICLASQTILFFALVASVNHSTAWFAAAVILPVEHENPFPFKIICWILLMLISGLVSASTAPFCDCATKSGLLAESAAPNTCVMLVGPDETEALTF